MEKQFLIDKLMNGIISEEELNVLKSDPKYASYLKIADYASQLETPSMDVNASLSDLRKRITKENSKLRYLRPLKSFMRIAAVLAVLFGSYIYLNTLPTTMSTDMAESITFNLPDQSEIILNADSEIEYKKNKWETNRSLDLNGEAYFKVSKGNTFTVNTIHGKVRVLGTQFNVYSRNDVFNITCFEGLVSVTFNDTTIKVPAGNQLKIENNKVFSQNTTLAENPMWINHESHFENTKLQSVIEEIERQYGKRINTTDINTQTRFTGSFTHNNLELALKSICIPLQLAYKIQENGIILYGKGN